MLFFDNLYYIVVVKLVGEADTLGRVLDGGSPNQGIFKLLFDGAMDCVATVLDRGAISQNDSFLVAQVWLLARFLGEDANHV